MTVEKPKQLLRPITTGTGSAMNQSQFLAITCNSLEARERSRVNGAIGSLLIGRKTGASLSSQSLSVAIAITELLSTVIWKLLYPITVVIWAKSTPLIPNFSHPHWHSRPRFLQKPNLSFVYYSIAASNLKPNAENYDAKPQDTNQPPFWNWNEAGRASKLPRWQLITAAHLSAIMTNGTIVVKI